MPEESMRAVPFDEGDVRWVFPAVAPGSPIQDALARISGKMEGLARSHSVRPCRSGSGLEYIVADGFPLAGVFGRVEVSDVIFRVDVYFLRRCGFDLRWGPPWNVEASVEVRVPQPVGFDYEDGYDYIEIEKMADIVTTEDEAVARSEAMVDWLIARSAAEELGYWHIQADQAPPPAG